MSYPFNFQAFQFYHFIFFYIGFKFFLILWNCNLLFYSFKVLGFLVLFVHFRNFINIVYLFFHSCIYLIPEHLSFFFLLYFCFSLFWTLLISKLPGVLTCFCFNYILFNHLYCNLLNILYFILSVLHPLVSISALLNLLPLWAHQSLTPSISDVGSLTSFVVSFTQAQEHGVGRVME